MSPVDDLHRAIQLEFSSARAGRRAMAVAACLEDFGVPRRRDRAFLADLLDSEADEVVLGTLLFLRQHPLSFLRGHVAGVLERVPRNQILRALAITLIDAIDAAHEAAGRGVDGTQGVTRRPRGEHAGPDAPGIA